MSLKSLFSASNYVRSAARNNTKLINSFYVIKDF